MEFVFSSILALIFIGLGFAAGMLVSCVKSTGAALHEAEEPTEQDKDMDRQWEALFKFDGRADK